MKCKSCKEEFTEGYCRDCYLNIQGDLLNKVMRGDPNFELRNLLQELNSTINKELNLIQDNLKELNNSIKDFKIRGLKLKSMKEREV